MIPLLLVLGLVLGAFVHDRRSVQIAAAVVVVVPLAWGIMVGVADGGLSTVVGASLLGFGNVAIGAGFTGSIRGIARRVMDASAPAVQ